MAVEAERRVTPGLGFPALPGSETAALGWPGADGVERSDVSRETGVAGDVATEPAVKPVVVPARESGSVEDAQVEVGETDSVTDLEVTDVSRETELTESEKAADALARVSRDATDGDVADIPQAGADTPLAQAVAADTRKRITLTGRDLPRPAQTRVLTVANQKGGVGKTTTTVNVAAALAQAGARVLVIDLDPQGNASTALGIDHHAEVPSIYDVLVDGDPLSKVVQACPDIGGLFCAPATIDLAGAEIELVSLVARETRLQKAVTAYVAELTERGESLDYVFVDCPPSLGLLTVNAFVAASEVFIPIQCEYYALEGLSQLLRTSSSSETTSTRRFTCRRSCSRCSTAARGCPPRSQTRCATTSPTRR